MTLLNPNGPCNPLRVRKVHPCNGCGEPIPISSKVYKHQGWVDGQANFVTYTTRRPAWVWYYLCESCHFLRPLKNADCCLYRKNWDPKVVDIGGKSYLRQDGRYTPFSVAPNVVAVLVHGKLVWERK